MYDGKRAKKEAVVRRPLKELILTFDLNTLEAHGHSERVFHTTSDLFVMVSSGNVENFEEETVLILDFGVIDEPLVAVVENRGVGHGHTTECSLKEEKLLVN